MTATCTWSAWSCTVRLTVTDPTVLGEAAATLRAVMADVDRLASRFRTDSWLSRANRLAGRPLPVPRGLVDLVGDALDAARTTDGAVDPTLGRLLAALGYDRDIAEVRGRDVAPGPDPAAVPLPVGWDDPTAAPLRRPDWRDVRLDREAGLLTVPPGTALDLGATAKAATADRVAAALAARHATGVLVEIGGDVAVAGPAPHPRGWAVAVAEAEGGPAEQVLLARGGIATSTTTLRAWRRHGRPVHHVLDPRTGRPTDGPWRTATVVASGALGADVASTAALVLGADAPRWLAARGLPARLVGRDGEVVRVGGWPAPVAPTGGSAATATTVPGRRAA